MYDFKKLQTASTGKTTFVTANRKELHGMVRQFLVDSVKAYAESKSHKLDARVGLRVALEFSKSYGPHMRSALSKVNGTVAWQYDNSGEVSYKKVNIERKPESVDTVLEVLNAALDTIDADNAKPERSEADKLASQAKSYCTSTANFSHDKAKAVAAQLKDLDGEQLKAFMDHHAFMLQAAQACLTLEVKAG